MFSQPAEKANPVALNSETLLKIANAVADWKDNTFHAEFEVQDLQGEAGIVGLQAHLGEGKVRLEYLMKRPDFSGLRWAMKLQEEMESTQSAVKPSMPKGSGGPWSDLQKGVYDFLMCQAYLQCAEALRERGSRLRGSDKDEYMLLLRTNDSLSELFETLRHKIRTGRKGIEFVRHLLSSEDDNRVALGLSLASDHFMGSLQDDLQSLCQRRKLPDDLRKQSFGLLAPERRRALVSWRRGGTTAGVLASK